MSEDPSRPAGVRLIKIAFVTIACALALLGVFAWLNTGSTRTPRNATSLATATALEMASTNFFYEYDALPDVGSRVRTDTPGGVRLLEILLGLEGPDKPQNTRRIKFLSVKEGKNRLNGLIYNSDGTRPEGLFDRWGNPYTVELDTQYKEHLHFTLGSQIVDLKGRRSTAYSPGADGKLGTADDVRTW